MEAAAEKCAQHLHRYEGASWPPCMLREGEEPASFWAVLREGEGISEAHTLSEVESYSKDFEIYYNAAISSDDPIHRAALIAAPSPRAAIAHASALQGPFAPASPNERSKKYRRSDSGMVSFPPQCSHSVVDLDLFSSVSGAPLPTLPAPLSQETP